MSTPLNVNLRDIARKMGGTVSHHQALVPGPGHSAHDRSLSIKLDPNAPGGFLVCSHAGDDPLLCKDFVRSKMGWPAFQPNGNARPSSNELTPVQPKRPVIDDATITAALAAIKTMPPKPPRGQLVATYDYKDKDGTLLYQVLRFELPKFESDGKRKKTFSQRRPNGRGGWVPNLNGVPRILYLLTELLKYPDATVFIPEGEGKVDRIASHGLCSTTVACGDWKNVDIEVLRGRDVMILEDNDEPGRKKALAAAEKLHGVAATVRIVRLPGLRNKQDVSDWFDADPFHNTTDKLIDICFDTPLWTPTGSAPGQENESGVPEQGPDEKNALVSPTEARVSTGNGAAGVGTAQQAKPKTEPKLALTFFDQLTEAKSKPWLIKNVIARGEASSWIAPPGKGKSALLTDIAIHLASGSDWRGYRTRTSCGVLYLALERADLVKRRLFAHRQRDGLPSLPIAVAGQVIDLMNRGCVEIIHTAIKQAEQHFGCEVGLVVIDTYPKGIAAGGGDENQAKDQNIVLANLRRILDQVNIHIAGIGHTGKDENRGERGSNARLADVDVQVQVTGDTIKTATVKKANDQPEGTLTGFRLEPVEFGTDEDGDALRTFILAKEILDGIQTERPLSDRQRLALEALTEATLSHGCDLPAADGLPRGLKSVSIEQWKAELYRRNVLDQAGKNPRARFNELRDALAVKKLIGIRDELVWAAYLEK
jgi:hypothetical protein